MLDGKPVHVSLSAQYHQSTSVDTVSGTALLIFGTLDTLTPDRLQEYVTMLASEKLNKLAPFLFYVYILSLTVAICLSTTELIKQRLCNICSNSQSYRYGTAKDAVFDSSIEVA